MRKKSGETIKKWGDEHQEEKAELGRKYGPNNIQKWNESEEGKEFNSNLGKIWGPINGNGVFKEYNKSEKGKKHIKIQAYKNLEIINNSKYQFCENCNCITPHTIDYKCKVCETKEYVWCNKCNKFENIQRNSIPYHWLFYKSITKKWIKEFPEEFDYIQSIIDFKDNINGLNQICGIYLWRIDNVPYYSGKSYDILSRSYDHMYEIQNDSKYWLNIKNTEINSKHIISIEVLQECDKNISDDELHNIELEWIAKIKPISQKCNGTYHIIPLNQRDYNIDNLKEKYEERMNYIS